MHSVFISKLAIATAVVLVALLLITPGKARTRLTSPIPQWQIDAGGKMAFEVASVKETAPADNLPGGDHSNLALTGDDNYVPAGGLLSVSNGALVTLFEFAYKLSGVQYNLLYPQIPKWANEHHFEIQARAPSSNPTRDQYRLMMQDLLAKRFKLAVHWETRQLQVFGLTPAKVGKLGPQVRVHSDEPPCSDVAGELPGSGEGKSTSDRIPGGFPAICRQLVRLQPCPSGHDCWGARNLPLGVLAPSLLSYFERSLTNGHPIVDRTALSGNYDFFFDFGDDEGQPKGSGRTLLEALKEQLGLKLESQAAPVDVLVIDHVEEPSPN